MKTAQRVLLIGVAAFAVWLLLAALDRGLSARLAGRAAESRARAVAADDGARRGFISLVFAPGAAGPIAAPTAPIAGEALVFRLRPRDVAADPRARRRADAHPRTLATFRALRAYPGAPPRVPHGLTAAEFRQEVCNTCHERGGYSARFGAYVPLTPHPELQGCLQCHATDAAVVGTPLPDTRADALCRQCHAPARPAARTADLDWMPAPWPRIVGAVSDGIPPEVPHDLHLRGNCLACHMGPGAVTEIRTGHPERANCRQCHLVAAAAGPATTFNPGSTP
jgi:nitrate reductase (cytochrome), electron transfer subunit